VKAQQKKKGTGCGIKRQPVPFCFLKVLKYKDVYRQPLLFPLSVHFKRRGNFLFEPPQTLLGKVGDVLQVVGSNLSPLK
jgi:hypothetical protein